MMRVPLFFFRSLAHSASIVLAIIITLLLLGLLSRELGTLMSSGQEFGESLLYLAAEAFLSMAGFYNLILLLAACAAFFQWSRNSELLALSTVGYSPFGLMVRYGCAGGLLILLLALFFEVVPLGKRYLDERRLQRSGEVSQAEDLWLRDGNRFIHIERFFAEGHIAGATLFLYDSSELEVLIRAETALAESGRWRLSDALEVDLASGAVERHARLDVVEPAAAIYMRSLQSEPPALMTSWELAELVLAMRRVGLSAALFADELWSRLLLLLSSFFLLFIGAPLASTRSTDTRQSLVLTGRALIFGMLFIILQVILTRSFSTWSWLVITAIVMLVGSLLTLLSHDRWPGRR